MSFFGRMFNWASSEANAAMDKLEDPVKMTEQGIKNLKADYAEAMKGLAEIKGMAIRAKKDAEEKKSMAESYEQKAMMLLKKAQDGSLDAAQADTLATEALGEKEKLLNQAAESLKAMQNHEAMVSKMNGNVTNLKNQINKWESELVTLKSRSKVAKASEKLNKQLAKADGKGTIEMLEKMKNKVSDQETLAQSYGEIADTNKSLDEQLNDVLSTGPAPGASDSLAAMKAKMGIK